MTRFTTFFCVAVLLGLATAIKEDEIPRMATPMTHMLLQQNLHDAIRTRQHLANKFFGRVKGRYEMDGGSGDYHGNFNGVNKGKKTNVHFNYNLNGDYRMMQFYMKYNAKVNGKAKIHGKNAKIRAYFNTKTNGKMHGKSFYGRVKGQMFFRLVGLHFYITERGRFNVRVGGKKMTGSYEAYLDKNELKVRAWGHYAGKKFYFKYAFSLNVLKLIFGMDNPFMINRNYGTVYVTVNGKEFTQKYDMKGFQLPNMNNMN